MGGRELGGEGAAEVAVQEGHGMPQDAAGGAGPRIGAGAGGRRGALSGEVAEKSVAA